MTDLPSWAVPGVEVICVDANRYGVSLDPFPFVLKARYVLLDFERAYGSGRWLTQVRGVREDSKTPWGSGCIWYLSRFAPLPKRTQEQDMELFVPLLDVPLTNGTLLETLDAIADRLNEKEKT